MLCFLVTPVFEIRSFALFIKIFNVIMCLIVNFKYFFSNISFQFSILKSPRKQHNTFGFLMLSVGSKGNIGEKIVWRFYFQAQIVFQGKENHIQIFQFH